MNLGYARVSSKGQDIETELRLLKEAGAEKIYQEKESGTKKDRQALNELIDFAREGDTVFFNRVDRIGRDMFSIIHVVNQLIEKKVDIVCTQQQYVDTRTTEGRFFLLQLSAYAELENELRKNRIEQARQSGRLGGRKKGVSKKDQPKIKQVAELYQAKDPEGKFLYSVSEIVKTVKISKRTLYKYLALAGVEKERL